MLILVDVLLNPNVLTPPNVVKIRCGIFVEILAVKSNVLEAQLDLFKNLIIHVLQIVNKDVNVCQDIFDVMTVHVLQLVNVTAVD